MVLHAQQGTVECCVKKLPFCRSDKDTCLDSVMTNKNFKFSCFFLFQYTVPNELKDFFPPCFLVNHIISKIMTSLSHVYTEILWSKWFQALISLKFIFTYIFIMLLYDLENICPKMGNWCTADSVFTCSPWLLKWICLWF